MSQIKKNIGYQTVYQVLAVVIPLVTSPYLSRILGADGLGIFSYTHSVVNYFALFAALGVSKYGMRVIAQSGTREEISRNFCGLFTIQLLTSVMACIVFGVFVSFVPDKYRVVYAIESFYVISELVNINWLYFGLEKFKVTVTRNIIIKILTTIAIFVFVQNGRDLWKYIFIMAFGQFLSNLVLWFRVKKYVDFTKVDIEEIRKHIKPNLVLFIPVIAASVYHAMDKTMLGFFSGEEESGYYYNADKLLSVPFTVVVGCCNVIMAQISVLVRENKEEDYKSLQGKTFKIGMLFSCAIAFGIAAVSDSFCPLFFGKGFYPTILLVKFFALIIIVKTISTITCSACLIPQHRDRIYIISVLCGAAVNFIVNLLLIKVFNLGALGATIGTLISEIIVMILQSTLFTYSHPTAKYHIRQVLTSFVFIPAGIIMFILIQLLQYYLRIILVFKLLILILIGGIIYVMLVAVYTFVSRDKELIGFFRVALHKKKKKL